MVPFQEDELKPLFNMLRPLRDCGEQLSRSYMPFVQSSVTGMGRTCTQRINYLETNSTLRVFARLKRSKILSI